MGAYPSCHKSKKEVPMISILTPNGKEYIIIKKNDVATCSIKIRGLAYKKKIKMFCVEDMITDFVVQHMKDIFTDTSVRLNCNFSYQKKYIYNENELFNLQKDIKNLIKNMFLCHSVLCHDSSNLV